MHILLIGKEDRWEQKQNALWWPLVNVFKEEVINRPGVAGAVLHTAS